MVLGMVLRPAQTEDGCVWCSPSDGGHIEGAMKDGDLCLNICSRTAKSNPPLLQSTARTCIAKIAVIR